MSLHDLDQYWKVLMFPVVSLQGNVFGGHDGDKEINIYRQKGSQRITDTSKEENNTVCVPMINVTKAG